MQEYIESLSRRVEQLQKELKPLEDGTLKRSISEYERLIEKYRAES
jgi:hypothetical protein